MALHGDIDITHADGLRRALLDLIGVPLIVVDLAEVASLDSTILGVLAGGARRASDQGGRLITVNETGIPLRALRITGLDRVLSAADS